MSSLASRIRWSLVLAVATTAAIISAIVLPMMWFLSVDADRMVAIKDLGSTLNRMVMARNDLAAVPDPSGWLAQNLSFEEAPRVLVVPVSDQPAEPFARVDWERAAGSVQDPTLAARCRGNVVASNVGLRGPAIPWVGEPQPIHCGDAIASQVAFTHQGRVVSMVVIAQVDPVFARQHERQLAVTLALATAVSLGVALAVAQRTVNSVQRPVREASAAARRIAEGDLEARIPVGSSDELAAMSTSLNAMADSLTGMVQRQRRFVADVAHELRTPTATLLASATALEDPQHREAAAALVVPQVRRLARLTEELLEISRIDDGAAPLRLDEVDLAALVRDEVAASCLASRTVVVGSLAGAVVCDAPRIALVVRNLLANAARHGRPPVRITLEDQASAAVLTITDAGDGVPASLAPAVFDRFVRGDSSRHGEGSGLGLSLARENARLHGGDLTLDEDGRTFRIVLPRGVA